MFLILDHSMIDAMVMNGWHEEKTGVFLSMPILCFIASTMVPALMGWPQP